MSNQTDSPEQADIQSIVREHYGQIADKAAGKKSNESVLVWSSCCGTGDCVIQLENVVSFYQDENVHTLPTEVTELSLGCGDPVTLASLKEGQTVLDLGSGGGIDCFLAARKVGATGKVIGVDMTPTMLERARSNQRKMKIENVEFRLGEIEHLPVADDIVDVIISNCVINLSPDKPQVLREAYRVLKPGGYLSISDIATDGPLPADVKESLIAWAGCVAGALEAQEYISMLEEAGFVDVVLKPVYFDREAIDVAVPALGIKVAARVAEGTQRGTSRQAIFSANIKAYKP